MGRVTAHHALRAHTDGFGAFFVSLNSTEVTAWHEAGHAFVAIYLGGEIDSMSIDPDWDDGPNRFGDTTVRWHTGRFTERTLQENAVLVALAGPVTEMLHSGDIFHPATVAEWSLDWSLAWEAASFVPPKEKRRLFLEGTTLELHRTLSLPNHWAAIGAIVDNLLAHEILEGDAVHEIVAAWT